MIRALQSALVILAAILCGFLASGCSNAGVLRVGKVYAAGATSFLGKQALGSGTITTAEGDHITLNGYDTGNPDPDLVRTVRDGVLIKAGIDAAQKLTQPAADAIGAAIAP